MTRDPLRGTQETPARWFDRLERRRRSMRFDRLVRRRRTLLREPIAGATEQLDEIAREIAEDGPVEPIHD